jgi:L-fucose isomerase-like protein
MIPRIAFFPIARTTFDIELAQQVTDSMRQHLAASSMLVEGPNSLITDLDSLQSALQILVSNPPDLLLIFQATFADSSMVMSLAKVLDAPIFLWAVPEEHLGGRLRLNSFCGINLAGHALTRAHRKYGYAYAAPGDPQAMQKLLTLARAGYVRNLMRRTRLGRVGENPAGFETCLLNPQRIRRVFGTEVMQFDLAEEFFPLTRQVGREAIDALYGELGRKVVGLDALDPVATHGALSVYIALDQLAQKHQLGGFAVRCWPEFFTELGCAACGAMSMMSDEGVPCSCEADVNGTLTQMILQAFSGEAAFGSDMVSLDESLDALVLWHCGLAPLSMADPDGEKGVTIHSNRKLPMLFDFALKPGVVTIARLTESSGDYRLVVGRAEMLRAPKHFSGTSGLLHFDRPARQVMDDILNNGLEHHISLTYGDYVNELLVFADILNIPVLRI